MYVLLSGAYPFSEDDRDRKIATASFSFQNRKVWSTVSEEAKNLIRQLLVVNPEQRLTAKQALENVWFTGTTQSTTVDSKMPFSSSTSSSSVSSASATVISFPPPDQMQVSESQPPPHPPAAKGGRKAKGGTAKAKVAVVAKAAVVAPPLNGSSAINSAAAPTAGRSTRSSSRKGDGKINDKDAMPPPKGRPSQSPAKQKRTGAMDKWLSPAPMEIPVDEDRQHSDSARDFLPEVTKAEKENLNIPDEPVGQRKRTRSGKETSVGRGKKAKPVPVQEQQQQQDGAASTSGGQNHPNPLDDRFALSSSLK